MHCIVLMMFWRFRRVYSTIFRQSLSILLSLCEVGVNPEALAVVVKELQKEKNSIIATNT